MKINLTPKQKKWIIIGAIVLVLLIAGYFIYNYRGKIQAVIQGNPSGPSDSLIAEIKSHEGCRLTSYQDTGGLWHIGWGHHDSSTGPGQTITQDAADQLLLDDVTEACNIVLNLVNVPMNQGQLDALTDFEFSTGALSQPGEQLLQMVNNGDWATASDWITSHYITDAAGNLLSNLQNERNWESQQMNA